jgi:DNA-binding NtrC family response regulator
MVQAAKILVVDDEPTVTKGCRRILGEAGYDVDTVATGRDGLSRALEGNFDLVVTDLRLPDFSGMELVRTLRARRPETAIVIITGYGSVPNAVEAIKLGVSDYVEKPFSPEQIAGAVGRAIAAQSRPGGKIEADLVRDVLRRAAQDEHFGQQLLSEGSRVLSGYALTSAAKAAIASGDLAWIEKEVGELSPEERDWLKRRLEAEVW